MSRECFYVERLKPHPEPDQDPVWVRGVFSHDTLEHAVTAAQLSMESLGGPKTLDTRIIRQTITEEEVDVSITICPRGHVVHEKPGPEVHWTVVDVIRGPNRLQAPDVFDTFEDAQADAARRYENSLTRSVEVHQVETILVYRKSKEEES